MLERAVEVLRNNNCREEYWILSEQMPQPQTQTQSLPTEDDYWAATDKEVVRLRGIVEYCGRMLCGAVGPRNNVPNGRVETAAENTPAIGDWVYPSVSYPWVRVPATISTNTVYVAGQPQINSWW
jgi:hypothetical protein